MQQQPRVLDDEAQRARQQRVDELEQELVTVSARVAAGEYRQLCLIRELEDIIVLPFDPYPQWLAWRLGIELSTAYERIRVARALKSLPVVSAAFAEGRLSYSKVRLIAAVATPETDAEYAKLAQVGGVRYLSGVVRVHKKVLPKESEAVERKRYFDVTVDDDGMFVVRGRLAPDEGALLMKALDAAQSATNADNCEAITQVATAAVAGLAKGDDLILHVHNDEHICAVEGHACSRATADRLICQNPHNRKASKKQVRALKALQAGACAYPACKHRRHLHAHHIVHWSLGGKTTLDNLILVCSKHHRLVHEGGWGVRREQGALVFLNHRGVVMTRPLPKPIPNDERDLSRFAGHVQVDADGGDDPSNTYGGRDLAITRMQWLMERGGGG